MLLDIQSVIGIFIIAQLPLLLMNIFALKSVWPNVIKPEVIFSFLLVLIFA